MDAPDRHPTERRSEAAASIQNALRSNAEFLDLGGFGLRSLPPDFGELSSLRRVELRGNALVSIPESISHLVDAGCEFLHADISRLPRIASQTPVASAPIRNTVPRDTPPPGLRRTHRSASSSQGTGSSSTKDLPLHLVFGSADVVENLLERGKPFDFRGVEAKYEPKTSLIHMSFRRAYVPIQFDIQLSSDRKRVISTDQFKSLVECTWRMDFVKSGLLNARLFTAPAKPVLPDETKRLIVDDVTRRFVRWNSSRSLGVHQYNGALKPHHRVLALMMDSLYARAFESGINEESELPSDHELDLLFQEILDTLSRQLLPPSMRARLQPLKYNAFHPCLRVTLQTLNTGFNGVPALRALASEHRWRLLVDRNIIEILERHGINPENPLLAFIFDTDRHYASRLASGWQFALSITGEPVTVDTSIEIHTVGTGSALTNPLDTTGLRFGAYCTPQGMRRIADNMRVIADLGFMTMFETAGSTYNQPIRGTAFKLEDTLIDDPLPQDRASRIEAATVRELIEKDLLHDTVPLQHFMFQRKDQRGLNWTGPDKLRLAMEAFMAPVQALLESMQTANERPASDVIRRTIAEAYLGEEMLHAMFDGNYRLWGILEKNRWYAKAGEGLTLVRDPNLSDGCSIEEAAAMDKEGQEYVAFLSTQFKDTVESDPAYFDFSELAQLVRDRRIPAIQEKVVAARLYRKRGPKTSDIRKLIDIAIETRQPLQIKTMLTELPGFDAEEVEPGETPLLEAVAKAGDQDFCAHLFSIGADPETLAGVSGLSPEIVELVATARTIRVFADEIVNSGGDEFLFSALKSHNVPAIKSILAGRLKPAIDGGNAIDHFLSALTGRRDMEMFAILAVAREELREHGSRLYTSGEMKIRRRGEAGPASLLNQAASHPGRLGLLRALLYCISGYDIPAELKLEILLEPDHEGSSPLHKAVKAANDNAFQVVLRFVNALNIPAEKKLEALTSTDGDGKCALAYQEGTPGARMVDMARDWIRGLPLSEQMKRDAELGMLQ